MAGVNAAYHETGNKRLSPNNRNVL